MISFMSEHTAEYSLVGDIVGSLKSAFSNIVPMYILLSREGNSMQRMALRAAADAARFAARNLI